MWTALTLRGTMLALRFGARHIRALSSAPTVKRPQLDHSTEFLSKGPHRKHPGILHLNIVRLPEEAVEATRLVLKQNVMHRLEEHAASLVNYLWSRKRPTEDQDLRAKAAKLEAEFRAMQKTDMDTAPFEQDAKIKNQVLNALRKQTYNWQPLRYTEQLALVYLAARFDGGYAAVRRALQEIIHRVPDFKPQTLLDFGSGVGSVTWAAHALWGSSLKEYFCVDISAPMHRLSELIMRGGTESGDMQINGVYFRQYFPVSPKVQHDVVISAFSLNELANYGMREKTIQSLWRKTGEFLVLVENGTREGHQLLMEARDIVLKGGDKEIWDYRPACVFAPCPHEMPCPKLSEQFKLPCNFVQHYEPLPLSWKQAQRWEKFSFLIISRGRNDTNWPRLIGPLLRRTRHVHCHTCGPDGKLHHDVITPQKNGKDLYRCARNCEWGDRLPVVISDSAPDLEISDNKEIPQL